jgi:hypothetical protein
MKERSKAMVLASLAADSLALGVHWIYNTHVIDKKFGRVEHFLTNLSSHQRPRRIYSLRRPNLDFTGIRC